MNERGDWGFSSVVERLPSKCKALGSVPSSGKKKKKKRESKSSRKKKDTFGLERRLSG